MSLTIACWPLAINALWFRKKATHKRLWTLARIKLEQSYGSNLVERETQIPLSASRSWESVESAQDCQSEASQTVTSAASCAHALSNFFEDHLPCWNLDRYTSSICNCGHCVSIAFVQLSPRQKKCAHICCIFKHLLIKRSQKCRYPGIATKLHFSFRKIFLLKGCRKIGYGSCVLSGQGAVAFIYL